MLNGYDWRKVLEEYLLKGKEPLINNLISGRKYNSHFLDAGEVLTV